MLTIYGVSIILCLYGSRNFLCLIISKEKPQTFASTIIVPCRAFSVSTHCPSKQSMHALRSPLGSR